MANLKVAIVIYENTPLEFGGSKSIGTMIEQRIASALKVHEFLQDITVQFEPEEWHRMEVDFHTKNTSRKA